MSEDRINVKCDACGSKFKVRPGNTARSVKCSKCDSAIEVPAKEVKDGEEFFIQEALGLNQPTTPPQIDFQTAVGESVATMSTIEKARLKKIQQPMRQPADADNREFSALRFLAWLCKAVAWVIAALYVLQLLAFVLIALLGSMSKGASLGESIAGLLALQTAMTLSSGFAVLTLYVYAEIILLALQIEKNTFMAANRHSD